jgi:site-specific DNA-methyltransferase (adenine-specific)
MFERLPEPDVRRVYRSPSGRVELHEADCMNWLHEQADHSFEAVLTDPPYGMLEYTPNEIGKMRKGRGGVWRIPPSFGGYKRNPVPRFTVLDDAHKASLYTFFREWGEILKPKLVPGAHVMIATNPLLSHAMCQAMVDAGYEKRGEIVRLTQTLRGGDRPKNAETEFAEVTVMPRSSWEPWILLRKPCQGTVAQNLRQWRTGGLRRLDEGPFSDVIRSRPTRPEERALAPHPSLKPQDFLRKVARAMLPLGEGTVLDTFAGSGSTLAACEAIGYRAVGVELDPEYVELARLAIPRLSRLSPEPPSDLSARAEHSSDPDRSLRRSASQRRKR